jgi:hypothetical protein
MSSSGFPITIVIANPQPLIKIAGESDVIIVNYAVRGGLPGADGITPDLTDPSIIAQIISGLQDSITESELYQSLRERLNLIDQGATSLVVQTENLVATVDQLALADGANSAMIAQESVIRADETGALFAEYTVKIDNNGRVSGFGLASTPDSSEFVILADRFAVIDPDADPVTGQAVIPFIVDSGNVYISTAFIKELNADIINAGTLTGRTVRTAASGERFEVSADSDRAVFYDANGDVAITIGTGATGLGQNALAVIGAGNTTANLVGLYAYSYNSVGVQGGSGDGNGVSGYSDSTYSYGVYGTSSENFGVCGRGKKGGIYGGSATDPSNPCYGGVFEGSDYIQNMTTYTDKAPIRLMPSMSASAPTHSADVGALWVTSAGVLYICTGTTNWTKVGAQ